MQHQDDEKTFIGCVLHLLTTEEDVFIPFVCRQCGSCCVKVSVDPHYFNPYEIAHYLDLTVEKVIQTYFGEVICLDNEKVEWKQTKPMKPCVFLEGRKCKIYPIRPGPCEAFPISADFGDSGIGCPGRLEYVKASRKLGKGIPYHSTPYRNEEPPKVHVQRKRWKKTLNKYLSINPCKESIEIFVKVNDPTA